VEASRETSPQAGACIFLTSNRIAKDLANLFLSAAAMPASALLNLFLYIVVELSND